MSAERISTMDEMLHSINHFIKASKKFIGDKGYDEKLTEVMLKASDPDDIFSAEQLVRILSVVDNLTVLLEYLNKPIQLKGKLRVLKGDLWLDERKLKSGDKIEYMKDGRWKMAVIKSDSEKNETMLLDEDGKISDAHTINHSDGRMR